MLNLKPNCECCDRDLPADAEGAVICSFECTFCTTCSSEDLHQVCPNCGGDLLPRPPRPQRLLAAYPPSSTRVLRDKPCGAGPGAGLTRSGDTRTSGRRIDRA